MTFLNLTRLLKAIRYSCDGLRAAMKDEVSFQQELIVSVPLSIVAICLHVSVPEKLLLIGSLLLVLIAELFNTAVEALADRVSTDIHPLSKKAKDASSAAVFLTIILACLVWAMVLCL